MVSFSRRLFPVSYCSPASLESVFRGKKGGGGGKSLQNTGERREMPRYCTYPSCEKAAKEQQPSCSEKPYVDPVRVIQSGIFLKNQKVPCSQTKLLRCF